jgi:ribose 5-phosphate isomerase A
MTIGLGSGSTASLVVLALGRRVAEEGLQLVGVATSVATADLARSVNLPLRELDDVSALDLNLDGADEVDGSFQMIKGRGGALLREKLVVSAARRRVTVITQEKRVERLGQTMPIPVEVSGFGTGHIRRRLELLGAVTTLRTGAEGSPFVTDGGNRILDCRFASIDDASRLDSALQNTVGVFETGLFLKLCDVLVVGHGDHVDCIESKVAGRS